ncbi:hypothetical protein PMAYCL1PPCAC_05966, partial [Pristionchus mayeri]
RSVGRRHISLIACAVGAIVSPLLFLGEHSDISKIANHIIDGPFVLIVAISCTNMIEFLPRNLRFLAVSFYPLAFSLTRSAAVRNSFFFTLMDIMPFT